MPQWLDIVLASVVACYGGVIWTGRRQAFHPPHETPWISASGMVVAFFLFIVVTLAMSYPEWGAPLVPLIGGSFLIVRDVTKFRRAPSAEEFKKLFFGVWAGAGMIVMGTILVMQLVLLWPGHRLVSFILAGLMVYYVFGYFAMWVATRRYQRTIAHPDFAEDESGNPVRGAAPEPQDEELIETWEDLVRAQRRRRVSRP